MSSRGLCSTEGENTRLRYLPSAGNALPTKIKRTRKAPDFYSPETPPSKMEMKSRKVESDENEDSWKPETDSASSASSSASSESDSESEKSGGRLKNGNARRRLIVQKSPSLEHEHQEKASMKETTLELEKEIKDDTSESQEDEKRDKSKTEDCKQKEKKVKGVRELQNLLDGHAQVHKESRSRGLPSRRKRRFGLLNGNSESTWSNTSSRGVGEKEIPTVDQSVGMKESVSAVEDYHHHHQGVEDMKSRVRSQKTMTSSTENGPLATTLLSESVHAQEDEEEDDEPIRSSKRPSCYQNGKSTELKSNGVPSLCVSNGENGVRNESNSTIQDGEKLIENGRDDSSLVVPSKAEIKLPRLPMIKYGDRWFRARIKAEDRDRIFVEFTGFEHGTIKPFWIKKDSESVFKGSYRQKDWKHLGGGAWEPRPRKTTPKKVSGRGKRKGRKGKKGRNLSRGVESIGLGKNSRIINSFRGEQTYTADSEIEFTKSASGILRCENAHTMTTITTTHHHRQTTVLSEQHSPYQNSDSVQALGQTLSADCVHDNCVRGQQGSTSDGQNRLEKSVEQDGSHSGILQGGSNGGKDIPSAESFPEQDSDRHRTSNESRLHHSNEENKGEGEDNNSPLSRNLGNGGACPKKESKKETNHDPNRLISKDNNSSSGGNENSVERVLPARCRRKPGRSPHRRRLRSEEDQQQQQSLNQRPHILRRSARLGWKASWKESVKDDSSSEAECDDESLLQSHHSTKRATPMTLPMTRSGPIKYSTRSSQISELVGHGNLPNCRSMPPSNRHVIYQPRTATNPTKRGRKTGRCTGFKDHDLYDRDDEEIFELEDQNTDEQQYQIRDSSSRQIQHPGIDSMGVLNHLGVNIFAQIRKYLPYYNNHVSDVQLPSFVELMERLDGVKAKEISLPFTSEHRKTKTTTTTRVENNVVINAMTTNTTTTTTTTSLPPPLTSSEFRPSH